MKVSLADQYMRLVYDYDMDVEDALRDILAVLEKVAPGAIQNEIDNIEEYMGEFE